MLAQAWADFKKWSGQPFAADMSLAGWFAFLGLLIVILAVWRMIFMHIEEGLS